VGEIRSRNEHQSRKGQLLPLNVQSYQSGPGSVIVRLRCEVGRSAEGAALAVATEITNTAPAR
jgi:hypothetical protein